MNRHRAHLAEQRCAQREKGKPKEMVWSTWGEGGCLMNQQAPACLLVWMTCSWCHVTLVRHWSERPHRIKTCGKERMIKMGQREKWTWVGAQGRFNGPPGGWWSWAGPSEKSGVAATSRIWCWWEVGSRLPWEWAVGEACLAGTRKTKCGAPSASLLTLGLNWLLCILPINEVQLPLSGHLLYVRTLCWRALLKNK